ncbi:MAG: SLC13 family permease [bacterium]
MMLEAWITLVVVLSVLVLLAATRLGQDLVLLGALTLLVLAGVLSPDEAFSGFASTGLATVAVLYVVASGIVETGAMHTVGERLLGRPRTARIALLRLMPPVAGLSAFLNNTPLVAMFVPVIQEWGRRNRLPVSKLMIPLSYAAIFGGTCTLIGTSTNLVVSGLVAADPSLPGIGFFEIAWVGLPSAVLGIAFVILVGSRLLPDRGSVVSEPVNPKEYAVEVLVAPDGPVRGRTVEQAGLRHLPGLYLAEIERKGSILPVVAPTEILHGGDRLVFVGNVESVVDLYRIRGLIPAPDQIFKLNSPRPERVLIEAVVSKDSPFTGTTIREARFRTRYEAVVISVARDGRRVPGKIGDVVLIPGDTLLIEARPSFLEQYRYSRDFLLLSALDGGKPPRHDRAVTAGVILAGMVLAAAFARVPMLVAALVAAGVMMATRCTTTDIARRNIDWQVLITIGAAMGLGRAIEVSGAAGAIAGAWIGAAGNDPLLALAAVYLLTSLFTEVITNNATAVLMFALAKAAAAGLGVSFTPFIFAIMMAASASFATPIGYQTNLMVYGPGGYRFSDYLRIGVPLNLFLAAVTVVIAPRVWPF